jgi:hypothetical protein
MFYLTEMTSSWRMFYLNVETRSWRPLSFFSPFLRTSSPNLSIFTDGSTEEPDNKIVD